MPGTYLQAQVCIRMTQVLARKGPALKRGEGKTHGLWADRCDFQFHFPLISYVSLGKSLHFSESLSSPMKGIVTAPTL